MAERLRNVLIDGGTATPWMQVAGTLLAVVLPPVVAVTFFGKIGAAAFIAAMPAHLAAKDSGLQTATLVTLTTGLGGALALGDPQLALIVAACLSAMTAIACRHGFARPCLRGLFTWAVFTGPILPADDKVLLLTIYVTALAWSLGVTYLFGAHARESRAVRSSPTYSIVFGIALGAGMVFSVWVGRQFFGDHGFWFPLTFAVLWLPPFGQLFSRTFKRSAGTLLGVGAALAVAWLFGDGWGPTAIAALCLPVAFRILPVSYLAFTAMLTFAILEALRLVSDVDQLAGERLLTMLAAAAMTLVLFALITGLLRLLAPGVLAELLDADTGGDETEERTESMSRSG